MTKHDHIPKEKKLRVIGRNVSVDFVDIADHVPAKVDTGADSSSVWASNIRVTEDGKLQFTLFAEGSPHYTGEVITRDTYGVAVVRSASGHVQIRYRAEFSLRIRRKRVKAMFNLSERSNNKFPVLIGRRTLKHKFMVNVTRAEYEDEGKLIGAESKIMNVEMKKDPAAFYKKYFGKDLDNEL